MRSGFISRLFRGAALRLSGGLLLLAAFAAVSCTDDRDEEPSPAVAGGVELEESERARLFPAEGGESELLFRAHGPWEAVVADGAASWCRCRPPRGDAGEIRMAVRADANATDEERNATITLLSGGERHAVVVTQKPSDALTVTQTRFVLDRDGGTAEVEVRANVDFGWEVDVECADWLSVESPRTAESRTLLLRAAPNGGGAVRRGGLRVFGGGRTERIDLYQLGSDPAILLSERESVVAAAATTLRVEVWSNVGYEVLMPDDAPWLADVSTRVLSSHTRYFAVEANPDCEDRTAEIRFVDPVSGRSERCVVLQKGRSALAVAKESYRVAPGGGFVRFDVAFTGGFEVDIPVEWIRRLVRLTPRSLQHGEVILKVDPLGERSERRAGLMLRSTDDPTLQAGIEIVQSRSDDLFGGEPELRLLPWEGGSLRFTLPQGVTVSFTTEQEPEGWLRYAGAAGDCLEFRTEPNERTGRNRARILFGVDGRDEPQVCRVEQMPRGALVLAAERYGVPNAGGTVEVELLCNTEYSVAVSEEWVRRVATRTLGTELLRFEADPNVAGRYRSARVTLAALDGSAGQEFSVYQAPDDAVVLSEREEWLPDEGGEVAIELREGIAFEVVGPSVPWLRDVGTTGGILRYAADANIGPESRSALVVVCNTATGGADTVRVVQVQHDAIVFAESTCTVGPEGGEILFEAETNVPVEIEIEEGARSWLRRTESRSLAPATFRFEADPSPVEREGLITLRGGTAVQRIAVLQGRTAGYAALEREALEAFHAATGGAAWGRSDGWCSARPLGEWYGVTVEAGRVTALELPGNGLAGRLPEELGNLTALRRLDLHGNSLGGPLPASLGRLGRLQRIDLHDNRLEGDLPATLGGLAALQELDLSDNGFTGRLPAALGGLDSLHTVRAARAGFTGPPDALFAGQPRLRTVDLGGNALTGELPAALFTHPFTTLRLGDNRLSGILSRDVGLLVSLDTLDLARNDLAGDLPASLGSLTSLRVLRLEENLFSGTVPPAVAQLPCWPSSWWHVLTQRGGGLSEGGARLPAPAFEGRTVQGAALASSALYPERSLTVLFGIDREDAACSRLMSELIGRYRDYRQFGLEVVGYTRGTDGQIADYAEQNRIEWPMLDAASSLRLAERLPSGSGAVVLAVDPDGSVVYRGDPLALPAWLDDRFAASEPYASTDYSADGRVTWLQGATRGAGIDIVLMGDGFSDRDIRDGLYDEAMQRAMRHFFGVEPFASLRDCFNVIAVTAVSKHSGYFTGAERALGSRFRTNSRVEGDDARCRDYALRIPGMTEERLDETVIIVLMNAGQYAGTSFLYAGRDGAWGSGLAVCYFPLGRDEEMFARLLQHEACGHGFGKLADEYDNVPGPVPESVAESYRARFDDGWWANADFTAERSAVKWARFFGVQVAPLYAAERLGVYEGAFTYGEGAYRGVRHGNRALYGRICFCVQRARAFA